MEAFTTAIVNVMTAIFSGVLGLFSDIGGLIFTMSEAGAITGITGFGSFLAAALGLSAGTWALSKVIGLVNSKLKIGSGR